MELDLFGEETACLLKQVAGTADDLEWYPTTDEIIGKVYFDLAFNISNCRYETFNSILDIGCGNGKVLKTLKAIAQKRIDERNQYKNTTTFTHERILGLSCYGIEKSRPLVDSLSEDIFVIGSDFLQQTLLDKNVSIVFCNPPYSQFSEWVVKILSESLAKLHYLVIPERWKVNAEIASVLEKRKLTATILGSYDFLSADRKARAKVNLVRVDANSNYYRGGTDPFELWFEESFKIGAEKSDTSERLQDKKESVNAELVQTEDIVSQLVSLYNRDLNLLISNYKSLESIGAELLKELGVQKRSLMEGLKSKIAGVKNLYWNLLFDRLDALASRLTKSTREVFYKKLFENVTIDFTEDNIYAVVIWVVKNANKYFDTQLLEVYLMLSDKENIRLYKSNHRIIEDGWRYTQSKMTHYSLDYRIVVNGYSCFHGSAYEKINNLTKTTYEKINDVFVVAQNLGMPVSFDELRSREWEPGVRNTFHLVKDGIVSEDLFCDIKCYLNGNIHIRFNQEFMKKLNVQAARLNGWIKTPKEASEEFGISEKEATQWFSCNLQVAPTMQLLTGAV